ncbi:hypothetical protein ACET3Z_028332 [Daucus carota]
MLQKQRDAALEYWFLLESDLTATLIKGNYGLLELAFNRIDFLKPKVNAKLLEECKKGEEEALCTVKKSLISNGWWDRANRLPMRIQEYSSKQESFTDSLLMQFIHQNKSLVHPNVMEMVRKKDNEGIQMALNHIHYGSLQAARELQKSKHEARVSEQIKISHEGIERDFIEQYAHLVDENVLPEALKGVDQYVNKALYQIHSRIISGRTTIKQNSPTYKEVLTSNQETSRNHSPRPSPSTGRTNQSRDLNLSDVVFVSNLPQKVPTKEIWSFCKQFGGLKDIVLPRKRDRYGRRIGFIKARSSQEAFKLKSAIGGKRLNGYILKTDMAKSKKAKASKPFAPEMVTINNREEDAFTNNHSSNNEGDKEQDAILSPEVLVNETLKKEVDRSLVITTWKNSSIMEVLNTLDALDYKDLIVRSISRRKFLLTFQDVSSFQDADIEFIGLATLNNLIKPYGELVGISSMIDEELHFKAPELKVITYQSNKIDAKVEVCYEEKTYEVLIQEINSTLSDWEFNDTASCSPVKDNLAFETSSLSSNHSMGMDKSSEGDIVKSHCSLTQPQMNIQDEISVESQGIRVADHGTKHAGEYVLNTDKWKIRDKGSSPSFTNEDMSANIMRSIDSISDKQDSDKSVADITGNMVRLKIINKRGLVKVPVPFGNLTEILDLDNGLGPHSPVFDVAPNFGLGELNHISSMESQATIPGSYVHVSEPLFRALVSMALENSMPPQENNLMNTGFNAVTHHQDFLSSPNATGDLLALQAPLNLIHPSSQPQQNGQTLPPNSLDKGKGKMLYVLDDDDDDLLGSSFPDLQGEGDVVVVASNGFDVGSSSRSQ